MTRVNRNRKGRGSPAAGNAPWMTINRDAVATAPCGCLTGRLHGQLWRWRATACLDHQEGSPPTGAWG